MKEDNCSARKIAVTLRRTPSTFTRELKHFGSLQDRHASMADTPAGYYFRAASLRARRARFGSRNRSKLTIITVLVGVVHHFFAKGCSPSRISAQSG